MSEGAVEAYLSTVRSFWPTSPEPRLHRSRGSGRSTPDSRADFLVLPDPGSPRMLVPAGNPAGAARAMQRFSAGLTASDVVKRLGVSFALRARSGFAFPHRIEVSEQADSLRSWLSGLLGQRVDFSLALGPARANRKPVLQIFDARGRSIAFAKVGATPLAETHVQAETDALTALGREQMPAPLVVPRLLHAERWNGMLVLVMTALETSVWQRPARQWDLPVAEMDLLHGHFAGEAAPLPALPWWGSLVRARDGLEGTPMGPRFAAALDRLEQLGTASAPVVPGAWHGDWTPWNMGRTRGSLQLWDWERFELGAPAGLDRCHYGVNAVCRRDGATRDSVLAGLRLAGLDVTDSGSTDRQLGATYLASIAGRYLLGAESELGDTVRGRAEVMLDSLCDVLGVTA